MPQDVTIGFKGPPELKELLRAEAKLAGVSVSKYLALIVANRPAIGGAPATPPPADAAAPADMGELWQSLAGAIGRFAGNPVDAGALNALSSAAERVTRNLKDAGQLVPMDRVSAYHAAVDGLADDLLGPSLTAALARYDVPDSEFAALRSHWRLGLESALAEHVGDL